MFDLSCSNVSAQAALDVFRASSSVLIVRHPLHRMASAYWHFKLESEKMKYKYFRERRDRNQGKASGGERSL